MNDEQTAALTLPTSLAETKPPRQAPKELKAALKTQLLAVLEGELSARMLLELEQTATFAHKLLIVAGDPRAMANHRRGSSGGYGLGGPVTMGGMGSIDGVIGPDDLDAGGGVEPLAPAFPGENFGAETIRNLVAESNQPKLSDLMRSLELANKMKEPEMAEKIRAQVNERLALTPDLDDETRLALTRPDDETQEVAI